MVNGVIGTTRRQSTQTHTLPARVRTTIQSIKEIVGDFSDADIYMALKESNMDPNETAQKLLYQDPFHEVKRKGEKKKESMGYRGYLDSRIFSGDSDQVVRSCPLSDRSAQQRGYARPSPRNGIKEFRVVRDNRTNGNTHKEFKPANVEEGIAVIIAKRSTNNIVKSINGNIDSQPRHAADANASASRKVIFEDKRNAASNVASRVQVAKPNISQHYSAALATSIFGVYSSSTDPVHVASPDSRSPAAIGTVRREVGVVGSRQPVTEQSASNTPPNSVVVKGGPLEEGVRPLLSMSNTDKASQTNTTESVVSSISVNKSLPNKQYTGKPHQVMGFKKAVQQNKEWKPKSSQKTSVVNLEVIGTPPCSVSSPAGDCKELESEVCNVQKKLLDENTSENQNVIIPQHIRVPETDRFRLTFGSFAMKCASGTQAVGATEDSNRDFALGLTVSAPEPTTSDDVSGRKQVELLDDQVRNSEPDSSASGEGSETQLPSSPENLDNYGDASLVRDNDPSYAPSELQQQHNTADLSSFTVFDHRGSYNMLHFRNQFEETVQGQGLLSLKEGLTSHAAHSIPASTITIVQQQQPPPMAQMYPHVHAPHFADMLPYRQFLSPFYVPQMGMPGYSSNSAYAHPSNGCNYLLMPGGNSHHGANGLKYGIQQLKPVPGSNPTGFGDYASPTGYHVNAFGVVENGTGFEDSSRIKYKDGNFYVPNPQAETSKIWIQNPRELPSTQSSPYYNLPGQTPHAAYLLSHAGHASFNSTAMQSSHVQFPGIYTPPHLQPAALTNPHHLGPIMGGNIGVATAATGPQGGDYHQLQLGQQLNWTTNF